MKFLVAVAIGAYVVRPAMDWCQPIFHHLKPVVKDAIKDLAEHIGSNVVNQHFK